jgi:hypothetical protein
MWNSSRSMRVRNRYSGMKECPRVTRARTRDPLVVTGAYLCRLIHCETKTTAFCFIVPPSFRRSELSLLRMHTPRDLSVHRGWMDDRHHECTVIQCRF